MLKLTLACMTVWGEASVLPRVWVDVACAAVYAAINSEQGDASVAKGVCMVWSHMFTAKCRNYEAHL
jgi:hypothetical protein